MIQRILDSIDKPYISPLWLPVVFILGIAFGYFWAWKAMGGTIQ